MKQESVVVALRRQVEQERSAGLRGKRAYSAELKRRVMALVRQAGWGPARVSRELGLAESVLYRWSRQAPSRSSRVSKSTRVKLTRVEVVSPRESARTFALEFASGAKVVGLTLEELSVLLGSKR